MNSILRFHWYKDEYKPGWIHYYILHITVFIFFLQKKLKLKNFHGVLKLLRTPGIAPSVQDGEVSLAFSL